MTDDLKPYPAYKDSGIAWLGQIPQHWGVRRMKLLLRELDGRSVRGEEQLLRVSQYTGVTERRSADDGESPDTRAASLIGYKHVQENDLVINIMLAWNGSLGISKYSGIVSPAYCVYRFNGVSDPWYYHELLRLPAYKGRIKVASTGVVASRLRLYSDALGRIEALEPPISEQEIIARYVSYVNGNVNRFIRAKKQQIALLNEQKQAIISLTITRGLGQNEKLKSSGVEWVGDIPMGWHVQKLSSIARVFNGTTPSRARSDFWDGGTVPWLSSSKVNDYIVISASEFITERAFRETSVPLVPSGAVIIGLVGQGKTRGMTARLEISATINQNLAAIVPCKDVDGQFLHYWLIAFYKNIRELGRGGNQEALNCDIISRLRIPLPSLSEQQSIVEYLDGSLDALVKLESATKREIELIRELRTRLVADVVTGKLDVREAAAKLPDLPAEAEPLDEVEDMLQDDSMTEDQADEVAEAA